jgi:hypothetical protein
MERLSVLGLLELIRSQHEEAVMDDEIPKSVLDAIRELSDGDLVKLIKEINEYSWSKAQATLRLMMEEKENGSHVD